jgi:hypothetical protein
MRDMDAMNGLACNVHPETSSCVIYTGSARYKMGVAFKVLDATNFAGFVFVYTLNLDFINNCITYSAYSYPSSSHSFHLPFLLFMDP